MVLHITMRSTREGVLFVYVVRLIKNIHNNNVFVQVMGVKVLEAAKADSVLKTATFAGGCFWGLELAFQRAKGVVSTKVRDVAISLLQKILISPQLEWLLL